MGSVAYRILERATWHRPALYILIGDEIPFVQDGLHEGKHVQHAMQERFREVQRAQPVPWVEVRSVEERVAGAVSATLGEVAQSTDCFPKNVINTVRPPSRLSV